MTASRFATVMASALLALAVASTSSAQGKSGAKRPTKGPSRPPSTGAVSSVDVGADLSLASTTPFAWMDDAGVMEPGSVWLGASIVRWQGAGVSETIAPVIDAAVGVARGVQVSASLPRVSGGFGTTFFTAKLAIVDDDDRALKVAIGPTLEILDGATMALAPVGQNRVQWGLPVSLQLDYQGSRIFGSSGYFSPGIWYAGAGIGRSVSDRVGVSASFSHAWATSPASSVTPGITVPSRNEISGSVSCDLNQNVAVFGSVGRTLGVGSQEGGGTTLGFGLSVSAPTVFAK